MSIGVEDVEPDDRIGTETSVTPVPCVDLLPERHIAPIFVVVAKTREGYLGAVDVNVNCSIGIRECIAPSNVG